MYVTVPIALTTLFSVLVFSCIVYSGIIRHSDILRFVFLIHYITAHFGAHAKFALKIIKIYEHYKVIYYRGSQVVTDKHIK